MDFACRTFTCRLHFVGICTSILSEPPHASEPIHTQDCHLPSQLLPAANDRTGSPCKDQSNRADSPYSGLEFTVELNGYAEFGPFPPSCTSRGTSTARDCGNTVEYDTGVHLKSCMQTVNEAILHCCIFLHHRNFF